MILRNSRMILAFATGTFCLRTVGAIDIALSVKLT